MTVARFTHISETRYAADADTLRDPTPVAEIPLPKRATAGSAGYDFVTPAEIVIPAGGTALIPTGVRCEMEPGWVLMLFPRSSLGFRYGIRLCNTVGVIDSDYAYAENEGHIMVKMMNSSARDVRLNRGERFCQGVLLPYGTAEETDEFSTRTGGFGSTGR